MSKFKKAESWKEFYINFNQYIVVLYESRDRDEAPGDRNDAYDMLVKDWAEYCAVNKEYIHGGDSELKNKINKQMIYLLGQKHKILTYFLDIFFTDGKENVQDFSAIRTWINNEFVFQESVNTFTASTCVKKEDCTEKCISDSSVLIDFTGPNILDESFSESAFEEKGDQESIDLEQVMMDTLAGGAKIIGKMVDVVDNDIKNFSDEINSIDKPQLLKVKVVGPKKMDFLVNILDFLSSEDAGVIETEIDDYDIGIYAFTHENWGDLEKVRDILPTGKYRIACNVGPQEGNICMDPLFFDVWEFDRYSKQDILRKLRKFA